MDYHSPPLHNVPDAATDLILKSKSIILTKRQVPKKWQWADILEVEGLGPAGEALQ